MIRYVMEKILNNQKMCDPEQQQQQQNQQQFNWLNLVRHIETEPVEKNEKKYVNK